MADTSVDIERGKPKEHGEAPKEATAVCPSPMDILKPRTPSQKICRGVLGILAGIILIFLIIILTSWEHVDETHQILVVDRSDRSELAGWHGAFLKTASIADPCLPLSGCRRPSF